MVAINDVIRFDYVGERQQYWYVPEGVNKIKVEVYGASGGDATGGKRAGYGGYAYGELEVYPELPLYIFVGGKPLHYYGGFNGGGMGGTLSTIGAGGGGATDIRFGTNSISKRVIVGGGGGGASYHNNGGNGGGLVGGTGDGSGGSGGTQESGGTNSMSTALNATIMGTGANGQNTLSSGEASGAGGGGGYYGGAGGWWGTFTDRRVGGGGGGSSYVGTLENAGTQAGVNSGHGYAIITIIDIDTSNLDIVDGSVEKISKNDNAFSYRISTNKPNVEITEKVNGVTINTRTAKDGDILSFSIPDEIWDNTPYGGYSGINSVRNLIQIQLNNNKNLLYFSKILEDSVGISELVYALQNMEGIHFPRIKKILSSKTNLSADRTFEDLINNIAIEKVGGRRWASGNISPLKTFSLNEAVATLQLDFVPRTIITAFHQNSGFQNICVSSDFLDGTWRVSGANEAYITTNGRKPTSKEVPLYMTRESKYIKNMYWFAIE